MSDGIHEWFGLSYANFLVMPRSLLQSMPDEWQEEFAEMLGQFCAHWRSLPRDFQPDEYRVQPVRDGKLARWSAFRLPHYNRGRTRVQPDGTVTGDPLV